MAGRELQWVFSKGPKQGDRADLRSTRRHDRDRKIGCVGERIIVRFEGLTALDQLDVELAPAEILGLIGPNGAGKTTLVNVLTGFQRPTAGSIRIDGAT